MAAGYFWYRILAKTLTLNVSNKVAQELVKTIQERRLDNGHCKRLTESFKLALVGCHCALCRV